MSVDAPARTLREAYNYLDPLQPLQGEWLSRFYVERPSGSGLGTLQQELELDSSHKDKTLLTGARGSGKSTELHWIASNISPDYLVVMVDIQTKLNLGDMDYLDLLVLLGLETYRRVQEKQIKVSPKRLEDLRFWYQKHILEKIRTRGVSLKSRAKMGLPFAGFELDLLADAELRQIIRSEDRSSLENLIERLNDLLNDVQKKAGRRVFIIVDGLDKINLNVAHRIFVDHGDLLAAPACRILYTMPPALMYTTSFQQVRNNFKRIHPLQNIMVYERSGQPYPPGRNGMAQILHRRIAPNLIQKEALEALLHYSGGIIRELIYLTFRSVINALNKGGDGGCITHEDVEQAVIEVQNTYRCGLKEDERKVLARFYKRSPFIESDVDLRLIQDLYILEYNDSQGKWWAIHPIVQPMVEEWIGGSSTGRRLHEGFSKSNPDL